ncbi:RolB family protein (plasmid) [Agrobacterium deltaense]|uniref:RolB family protein n=1 Tax=Agrobacterium deltaense TaxID=1183412 RepID=UPI003D99DEC9
MEDELERQLQDISLITVLGPDVKAELAAALLDYRDDLDIWKSHGYPVAELDQTVTVDKLLYMYMDRATADWCVKNRCLVCNSGNSTAIVTSLPPYLAGVTSAEAYEKLNSIVDGSVSPRSGEPPRYFVAFPPSSCFEKTGEISVRTVDGEGGPFGVFTRQPQPQDQSDMFFKYEEVVCAGKSVFLSD